MNKPLLIVLLLFHVTFLSFSMESPISVFVNNYNVEDYDASCQNWGATLTSDGYLYVANNSGLLRYDGNTWKLYVMPDEDVISHVVSYQDTIYTQSPTSYSKWTYDRNGLLHQSYINHLPDSVNFDSPDIHLPFVLPEEIEQAKVAVIRATEEFYFVGTLTNGLYILDRLGRIRQHLSLDNQLQDNRVNSIFIQDPNRIWVSLDNGISRIQIHPSLVLLAARSKIGKLENAGLNDDILYLKTNIGYFKYSLKEYGPFIPVSEEEALFYLRVKSENDSSLWNKIMATGKEDLDDFYNAKSIYSVSNGLYWLSKNNEVALFQLEENRSVLKCRLLFDNYNMNLVTTGDRVFPLDESLVLFSTMQGTLLMNIREEIGRSLSSYRPLKVSHIEYIDDDGTHNLPLNIHKVVLPHDFRSLIISVGTTVLTSEHQISYKMEGVADVWSSWVKNGNLSFWQLPEGNYALKVRKYSIQGPSSEFTLPIEVRPAWYNSVWAWLAYIIIGTFFVREIFLFNLKNLRQEELRRLRDEHKLECQKKDEDERSRLEQALQKKDEELIYQTNALLQRNHEIERILDELNLQKEILGDRYPNKYYVRMKQLLENTKENKTDWNLIKNSLDTTHQNFTERLRKQYPDLTPGDLRVCCLLRMNLSTKEIASLMNISIRAVELRRYRLRKRLGLEADINLVDFLIQF